jgi:hypothetical protein
MRKTATKAGGVRRESPGWRFVTWVVVLAFALQSFVTQTHFHWAPQATTNVKLLESASRPHKAPVENSATCPFCQAIVHAGAFFASAAPLPHLPVVWADYAIPPLPANGCSRCSSSIRRMIVRSAGETGRGL